MRKTYDIRQINGKNVFVKHITDNFWLVDGIFLDLAEDIVFTDEYIEAVFDDLFWSYGYKGADKGYVLSVSKNGDSYIVGEYPLSSAMNQDKVRLGEDAYEEYRSWAGI